MTTDTISLFVQTQKLRNLGLQLMDVCTDLHQISLNAAISASHLESSFSQFPVLAKEIGNVAKSISNNLQNMEKSTTMASNCILEALGAASMYEKFEATRDSFGVHKSAKNLLTEAMEKSMVVVDKKTDCYLNCIHDLLQQVKYMEQTFAKSWGIVPYLRIAVNSSASEQSQSFLDIAKVIEDLNERAYHLILDLYKNVQSAKRMSAQVGNKKGTSYAA